MNIENGWVFYTADFSLLASAKRDTGYVTLCRCKEDMKKFNQLTQEDQDKCPLFVVGQGATFEDAIISANLAASHTQPIPSTLLEH
jgi:hypothetical protein